MFTNTICKHIWLLFINKKIMKTKDFYSKDLTNVIQVVIKTNIQNGRSKDIQIYKQMYMTRVPFITHTFNINICRQSNYLMAASSSKSVKLIPFQNTLLFTDDQVMAYWMKVYRNKYTIWIKYGRKISAEKTKIMAHCAQKQFKLRYIVLRNKPMITSHFNCLWCDLMYYTIKILLRKLINIKLDVKWLQKPLKIKPN